MKEFMAIKPIVYNASPDYIEGVLLAIQDLELPSGKSWMYLPYPERQTRPIPNVVKQFQVFVSEHDERALAHVRVRCAATIRSTGSPQGPSLLEFLDGQGVFSKFEPMDRDLECIARAMKKRLKLAGLLTPEVRSNQPQGSSERSTKSDHVATGRKGKPGRPRNLDDDWAWEQVNVAGRPMPEVYTAWKKRIGDRANTLADPLESFKKATKASRGLGRKK